MLASIPDRGVGPPRSATREPLLRATAPLVRRRILFVLNSFTFGGVEQHVAVLARELPRFGYEPVVALAGSQEGLGEIVRRLDASGVEHIDVDVSAQGALSRARAVWRLASVVRELGAALVHIHLTGIHGGRAAALGATLARVPAVVTHHLAPTVRTGAIQRLGRRALQANVRAYIAVSNANRRAQVAFLSLPADRVFCVHNGIAPSPVAGSDPAALHAYRASARHQLHGLVDAAQGAPLVGFVGRLSHQKGVHWLVRAAPEILRRVPETTFAIIGEGPERAALEAQAHAQGVAHRIRWLGFRGDASFLLAGFDVLAMPSQYEGLPLVLLEAMAAGLPTVAHAVDGIPEAIRNGLDGILVAPGDVASLADGIAGVLQDGALAAALGNSARASFLEGFTAEAMARDTARIYDRVVANAVPWALRRRAE